jgi:hypothetical protein
MKPALFEGTDNDRVVNDAGAEIFAATAALRTRTARIADWNGPLRGRISRKKVPEAACGYRLTLRNARWSPISDQRMRFILATDATMQIHFIAIGDVDSGCLAD